MATKITMPQLGESVVEGTVGEWLKQVGDKVEEFEPIIRVSTDKVDTEIPAPADGVLLAIYIAEGETVNAGVVLGLVGQVGESADADSSSAHPHTNGKHHHESAPSAAPVAVASAPKSTTVYTGQVSPVVARMAEEHQLDLNQIKGSGRNGRIQKKDVLAYLEKRSSASTQNDIAPWEQPVDGDLFKPTVSYEEDAPAPVKAQVVTPAAPMSAPKTATPAPAPVMKAAPATSSLPGELHAISGMRRAIAQHMVESKLHIAPHVTTVMEVDMSAVAAHRAANKAQFAKQNVNLTFTPYFIAACAAALQAYPTLNARWTDEGLYYHHVANIGMATALDEGLIVPVIKNAQDYNLIGLARQVNDLAERARQRKLQADEVRDGTFTITNHGVSGSIMATPIINQPQSAILGVGIIEKRVKVVNDSIAIRPCCYLSLTFDHRVADGAGADNFLMAVKKTLETWA